MNNFNVGDKVVCLHEQMAKDVTVKVGTVGVVTHICDSNHSMSIDNLMGYSGMPVFSPTAFELVKASDNNATDVVDVKKPKKWIKATPELIAELEVGDKVKLRNDVKAVITGTAIARSGSYPISHDKGRERYMACLPDGTNCLGDEHHAQYDIVKVRNKEYVA